MTTFPITMVLAALMLVLAGCGSNPELANSSAPPMKDWELKAAAMKEKLRVGMTQQEVLKLLGEPAQTKAVYRGGDQSVSWSYELTSNVSFQVRFDERGQVMSYRAASPIEIQL